MKKVLISAFLMSGVLFTANANNHFENTPVIEVVQQDDFKKIEVSNLPKAVTAAVARDFEGATIAEAYVSEDKAYKLVLEASGDRVTVYADSEGNWIKR